MPNTIRRILLPSLVLLAMGAFAQDSQSENAAGQEAPAEERIISIDYSGGSQSSENLRYGPIVFEHPDPEGIVGTVSNLTIYAQQAVLEAPEGVLIAQAEGEREASFTGGVRVKRGRLTATGPSLVYSEATGEGVMPEATNIVVAPEEEEEEPVEIRTDQVTFDVDTDVSVSEGNVTLVNGPQSAEAETLVFEEERNLAKLSSEGGQTTVKRTDEDGGELTITADTIWVLTGEDRLLAKGNVTIVDGDISTTGNRVFFDDEADRAEIFGDPAVSVDEANGVRLSGPRLEQRTDIDVVQVLDASVPVEFDEQDFMLTSELQQ